MAKGILPHSSDSVQLRDGVHPYDDPEDKWVVILDGEEVAWASDYAQAQRSYQEMLRVEHDHLDRNPANSELMTWNRCGHSSQIERPHRDNPIGKLAELPVSYWKNGHVALLVV